MLETSLADTLRVTWTSVEGLHRGLVAFDGQVIGSIKLFVVEKDGLRLATVHHVERRDSVPGDHGAMSAAYSLVFDSLSLVALFSSAKRTKIGCRHWSRLRAASHLRKFRIKTKMTDQVREDEVISEREPELVRDRIYALARDRHDCCKASQVSLATYGGLEIYEGGARLDCDMEFERRYKQEEAAAEAAMLDAYE